MIKKNHITKTGSFKEHFLHIYRVQVNNFASMRICHGLMVGLISFWGISVFDALVLMNRYTSIP